MLMGGQRRYGMELGYTIGKVGMAFQSVFGLLGIKQGLAHLAGQSGNDKKRADTIPPMVPALLGAKAKCYAFTLVFSV